jgi:hypothetical protein
MVLLQATKQPINKNLNSRGLRHLSHKGPSKPKTRRLSHQSIAEVTSSFASTAISENIVIYLRLCNDPTTSIQVPHMSMSAKVLENFLPVNASRVLKTPCKVLLNGKVIEYPYLPEEDDVLSISPLMLGGSCPKLIQVFLHALPHKEGYIYLKNESFSKDRLSAELWKHLQAFDEFRITDLRYTYEHPQLFPYRPTEGETLVLKPHYLKPDYPAALPAEVSVFLRYFSLQQRCIKLPPGPLSKNDLLTLISGDDYHLLPLTRVSLNHQTMTFPYFPYPDDTISIDVLGLGGTKATTLQKATRTLVKAAKSVASNPRVQRVAKRVVKHVSKNAAQALGNRIGGPALGNYFRSGVSALLPKIMGSGDYIFNPAPEVNSLISGSKNFTPNIETACFGGINGRTKRWCNSETLFPVTVSNSGFFNNSSFIIDPSDSALFKLLSVELQNYEKFKFHGLVFIFTPKASTMSTSGSISEAAIAVQENPNSTPYTTSTTMFSSNYCTKGPVYKGIVYGVECKNQPLNGYFNSIYDTSNSSYFDTIGVCNMAMEVDSTVADGIVLGYLSAVYDIEAWSSRITQTPYGYAHLNAYTDTDNVGTESPNSGEWDINGSASSDQNALYFAGYNATGLLSTISVTIVDLTGSNSSVLVLPNNESDTAYEFTYTSQITLPTSAGAGSWHYVNRQNDQNLNYPDTYQYNDGGPTNNGYVVQTGVVFGSNTIWSIVSRTVVIATAGTDCYLTIPAFAIPAGSTVSDIIYGFVDIALVVVNREASYLTNFGRTGTNFNGFSVG